MLSRSVVLLSLVFALALATGSRAQQTERAADRFTFKAGQAGDRLELVINRWSTDAERDKVFTAAQKDPAKALDGLENPGVVGWIHLPGGLDHTVRYARRVNRPDGSTDVIVIAERPVWIWWDPALKDAKSTYTYTAVQIHLTGAGTGEGKLSSASVVADKDAGVVLGNYAKEPTLLTEVKRDLPKAS